MKRRRKASSHTNLTLLKPVFTSRRRKASFRTYLTQQRVVVFIGNQEEETTQREEEREEGKEESQFSHQSYSTQGEDSLQDCDVSLWRSVHLEQSTQRQEEREGEGVVVVWRKLIFPDE